MVISVIGLGLIGGSFCRTIKKNTSHTCYGYDIDDLTMQAALECGAIDRIITEKELGLADLTILCLHPKLTISFVKDHAAQFRKGSIVMDTCGVKNPIVIGVENILSNHGIPFVGTHPMAGREFSGFFYSTDTLFDKASFIITPTENTPDNAVSIVKKLAQDMRFPKVVTASPEEHDRVIAFTSQLAHIVSNAYVKSPSLLNESGFSAGSFLDLTRVAKLNETMWTELFLYNSEPLIAELELIIGHLEEYRNALACNNELDLKRLLRDGRIRKEESLRRHNET